MTVRQRLTRVSRRVAFLLAAGLVAGACQEGRERRYEDVSSTLSSSIDWQSACEDRLNSAPQSKERSYPLMLKHRWRINPSPPLGRVVGLAWDQTRSRIVVADNSVSEISILDTLGRRLGTIGRYGEGPGDIDLRNMDGGTNRLTLLSDGAIAIADVRHLKVFAPNGQLKHWLKVDSGSTLDRFDMQLEATGQGELIAVRTGKQHIASLDFDERTRLTLVRVENTSRTPTMTAVGELRNSYSMLKPSDPFPGYQPYRRGYRRSWGTYSSGVVAQSWKHFGLCYFDWTGEVIAAHAVSARRIQVDAAERERVLKAEMGGPGPVPFLHTTAEALYRDNWPKEGPLYVDVVAREDGLVWALRWTPELGQIIDVFSLNGYLGSFAPKLGGLPVLLRGSLAFAIDPETGDLTVDETLEGRPIQ